MDRTPQGEDLLRAACTPLRPLVAPIGTIALAPASALRGSDAPVQLPAVHVCELALFGEACEAQQGLLGFLPQWVSTPLGAVR